MKSKYVIFYTLFSTKYDHGFKSQYRFFETKEDLERFIKIKNIKDNCMIFENIEMNNN